MADDLAAVRRAFAKHVTFMANVVSPALETAFAEVRREDYVGPGPWPIFVWTGYRTTPDANPARLYADVLVGLIPERGLNNGQPSGHAIWMAAADVRPGEHVVHVGAGVGYYSAILAHMAGDAGRMTAIEFVPELAQRAKRNLAHLPNVTVVEGDGTSVKLDPADVIYVNAGATRPMDVWLDALKEGGRLIVPLTTNAGFSTAQSRMQGAYFRITRRGAEFHARFVSPTAIIPGEGMRDAASEAALAAGFANGRVAEVTRLCREARPVEDCWAQAAGWALCYR